MTGTECVNRQISEKNHGHDRKAPRKHSISVSMTKTLWDVYLLDIDMEMHIMTFKIVFMILYHIWKDKSDFQ